MMTIGAMVAVQVAAAEEEEGAAVVPTAEEGVPTLEMVAVVQIVLRPTKIALCKTIYHLVVVEIDHPKMAPRVALEAAAHSKV